MKKLLIPLLAILAASCVQDNTPSTGEQARGYLLKWMERNHPELSPDSNGLYILEETEGTGDPLEGAYAYATITIRTLDGKISSSDSEEIAKQLLTFEDGNYYGPRFISRGENLCYAGVDLMLEGMKIGGKKRAIIPSWFLTVSRYSGESEYLNNCAGTSHLDYEICLFDQTDDITQWEKDKIEAYVKDRYGSSFESVAINDNSTADGTFWFIDLGGGEGSILTSGEGISLSYTGKLTSGKVFDTTDEVTAIDSGVFSSSRTYAPAEVTWYPVSEYSSVSLGGSTSIVDGFKSGVAHMSRPGQKAVALFTSGHGYGSSGSQNSAGYVVPPYAPLIFELEIAEQ